MKFILSFPEMWARIVWPFPMSTWNVVLGSASVTTPSTSIISDFAKCSSLLVWITVPAQLGEGLAELTVGDLLSASDLFSRPAVGAAGESDMLPLFPLGPLQLDRKSVV